MEILERALKDGCTKDEKKPLLSLLTKLHISSTPSKTEETNKELLDDLQALVTEAMEAKLGPDAVSRNFIAKLELGLAKRLGGGVAQDQDQDEDTEVPVERSKESAEVEDDTMLAEGTRMPLEDEEEDDDITEQSTIAPGKRIAVTEEDIMADLLDSEL